MYWEEFKIGQTYQVEPVTLSEEEIIDFAGKYDPQRIHIDSDFAKQGMFGGIISSGYQTITAVWAKWIEKGVLGDEVIAGTGVDKIRWIKPVYPKDSLSAEVEVIQTKLSSKGGKGTVTFLFTIKNQSDVTVTTFEITILFKARG
ncbi:MaoC/PaaZ C-terminal domain-containing protein [Aquibacillus kalidii]|uniref:MaoC/PaaZ C-terminal domain-containing protein n=1 Tax=Aquibacillus kalidii TaxID=2762597 RepID=UPI0016441D25|nr:MaoC/PaaZ C-terminal domain-containing protein [Aquibacillus kalidii]